MRYYDKTGRPISRSEWVSKYNPDEQRVAADNIGEVRVSTVWLGLDHSYGNGPPLIFETMIFGERYDDQEYQWRYSTEAEALAGHAVAVDLVRAAEGWYVR